MKYEVWLLVMLESVFGMRRGPHHPHGQTPVDQKHHHYKPQGSDTLTADSQLLHDTTHLEEDSPELTAEMLSRMSPEELEFHYFSAHDFDKNSMLDGLELLKAIYHTMEHEENNSLVPEEDPIESYVAMVDRTLELDDVDGDGFVSYAEYRAARQRGDAAGRTRSVIAE